MYGMIHAAARQLTLDRFGPEAWERIRARSGLTDMHFISGETYPDEATSALLNEIVAECGIPVDGLLRAFGAYWITYVTLSTFAAAFEATGRDFVSFIEGLDRLHRGVRTAMPRADMPKFEVLESAAGCVDVLYVSNRTGLEPFVEGLLHGLLRRFNEQGEISWRATPDGVVFTVAMTQRTAA